jgi:tetratricopeptide (TPR) repeat protein
MQNYITRKASILLVFGLFFISCSSIKSTESTENDAVSSGPLAEIEVINRQIEQNGQNESLLLRKTELFIEAAQQEELPSIREPFYLNARNTASIGISQFNDEEQQFSRLLSDAWSLEHNSGARLLQTRRSNDSQSDRTLNQAIDHLQNAIIIQPDSLSSYNVLSTAYYSSGLYSDAESTLQKLLEITDDPELTLSANEKLAFIYLESGDTQSAVLQYEMLQNENDSSITIQHGLINAYILNNEATKAIEQLQMLSNEYPDHVSYLESLASVKFQQVEITADSLLLSVGNSENVDKEVERLISELEQVKVIYDDLNQNSLMDEESTYSAAAYLMNGAFYLNDIRNSLPLSLSSSELAETMEINLLEASLPYWEQLIDLQPDNIENLNVLYTLYNRLNMLEEAESLEQSYNF